MGAGKTRCGKRLASKLGLPFIDMDHAIEAQQGQTVSAIFARLGEDGFRQMEHNWLQQFVASGEEAVVSTGGGAPCFYSNMDIMQANGITVWLNPSLKDLTERLWRNREERPKIASLPNVESLQQYIADLLEQRTVCYGKSRIVVGEAPPDMDWLVNSILQLD